MKILNLYCGIGGNRKFWGEDHKITAIEKDENESRPVNSVYWAGAANSFFTLDVENNVALVYFSNYFPFNDKEAYDFYKLYEKEVYKEINSK